MTNPAEYPITLDDLRIREDHEQAHILSCQTVDLYYDDQGFILRGTFKGQQVDDIRQQIVLGHFKAGRKVSDDVYLSWPWWRLFRLTRLVRIVVSPSPMFAQSFDDGGPE